MSGPVEPITLMTSHTKTRSPSSATWDLSNIYLKGVPTRIPSSERDIGHTAEVCRGYGAGESRADCDGMLHRTQPQKIADMAPARTHVVRISQGPPGTKSLASRAPLTIVLVADALLDAPEPRVPQAIVQGTE